MYSCHHYIALDESMRTLRWFHNFQTYGVGVIEF
jgi:hypothetical protein